MANVIGQLREAVQAAPVSRYRLSKQSGVSAASLCRLVSGERGLSIGCAEQLADALGMELILRPKGRDREKR